ncbi:MAG: hypothetical protein ACK5NN_00815 [Sphingomonadaceae bacterium]
MEIYRKKSKLLFGLIALTLFAILGVTMLVSGPSTDSVFPPFRWPWLYYPLSLAVLVGSIWFAYIAAKGLYDPRPEIILSKEGITINGFAGRISANWSELKGYTVSNGKLCVLKLKDPEEFIARQAKGRPRNTARTLTDRFGGPFLINTEHVDADWASIREYLAEHLQELKS